ncbi:hypothetical protein EXIGLDRAFT_146049 [Exidia glandulosa HHB12029]|uniref:F-box domain-containing protein n=1 Tax=Exidia glandulosa HHB12029 TaxID=1314781 RepID=A0A165FTJ2_EXIGL|nr:hypothetical protein EXIGLDRAFT_146049 [Exidia glandulosa HHB12029]
MLRSTDRDRLRAVLGELLSSSTPVMAHSASGVADASVLDSLYEEILTAARETFALRNRERNALLPVHQLPCDVLRYLATFLSFRERVLAGTVCSYWRECLITDERIWRSPILGWDAYHHTQMAINLFGRARNRLEHLGIQSDALYADGTILPPVIEPCMSGLTSLTISLRNTDVDSPWVRVLAFPAPNLEILRVSKTNDGVFELSSNIFDNSCPKLRTVLLHGYFDFSTMGSDSVSSRLPLTPNLERLIVSSVRYLFPGQEAAWTIPPLLKTFHVRRNITDGVFSALQSAVFARRGHVLCYDPIAMYTDTIMFRFSRPSRLDVQWIGRSMNLSLVVYNDLGASNGVSLIGETDVTRLFEFSLMQVLHVTALALPDTLWQQLCVFGAHRTFDNLTSLTVHLTHAGPHDSTYTHLFILQDPPLSTLCPALTHVRLIHDAMRGSAFGAYLRATADNVKHWLPSSVSSLYVRGIVIIDPGLEELRSDVEIEVAAFQPDDLSLSEDDTNWNYVFPVDEAWRL